jgi:pyridoxine 4-dehydrogenase
MTKPNKTFLLGGDLQINRLGFGAMRLLGEGVWGEPADPANSLAVLRRAVELGVNFIDTADSYGPAIGERQIAEALYPYTPGLVIATKAGLTRQGPHKWMPVGRPEYLNQQVEISLRVLKVDRIDLWQLHRIDPKIAVKESLAPIARLQRQGKIRHIGLSEVTIAQIEEAAQTVKIVSVQNEYNLGNRKHEEVLQYCQANNIAFIPWFPIAAGKLAQPGSSLDQAARRHNATVSQLSLAWLLHHSPVLLPIPGTASIAHLEENVKASDLTLSDTEWAEIEAEVTT